MKKLITKFLSWILALMIYSDWMDGHLPFLSPSKKRIMDDRFKLELYPEQLDVIISALALSCLADPPDSLKAQYQAVYDYLKPIQKQKTDFKKFQQQHNAKISNR
jgi:hypothetical protein